MGDSRSSYRTSGDETSGNIHFAYRKDNTWVRIGADLKSDIANMGAI